MKPVHITRIVDRKQYDTATATLLAGDDYWDGHNFERRGRNRFLYKTPNNAYFTVRLTKFKGEGERDSLDPVDLEEAIRLYEGPLIEHRVDFAVAFPHVRIVPA